MIHMSRVNICGDKLNFSERRGYGCNIKDIFRKIDLQRNVCALNLTIRDQSDMKLRQEVKHR